MDRTLQVLRIVKVRANKRLIWVNIGREFSTGDRRGPTLSDWLQRVHHGAGRGDRVELRAGYMLGGTPDPWIIGSADAQLDVRSTAIRETVSGRREAFVWPDNGR